MDLIPMRNEPQKEELRMNANSHDEPGTAQLEGDGKSAMFPLIATYGLRDSEVVAVSLEDTL